MVRVKCWTTTVAASRTIDEIEKLLAKYGAKNVSKEFDNGEVVAVLFTLSLFLGTTVTFKLPADVDGWMGMLKKMHDSGEYKSLSKRRSRDREYAKRVGWRVLKEWIDTQLTLVYAGGVKMEQVMLPYAYDYNTGRTLGEMFLEQPNSFNNLLPQKAGGGGE